MPEPSQVYDDLESVSQKLIGAEGLSPIMVWVQVNFEIINPLTILAYISSISPV